MSIMKKIKGNNDVSKAWYVKEKKGSDEDLHDEEHEIIETQVNGTQHIQQNYYTTFDELPWEVEYAREAQHVLRNEENNTKIYER